MFLIAVSTIEQDLQNASATTDFPEMELIAIVSSDMYYSDYLKM